MSNYRHPRTPLRSGACAPALALALLCGCASDPTLPVDQNDNTRAFRAPAPYDPAGRTVTQILSSRAQRPPAGERAELLGSLDLRARTDAPRSESGLLSNDPGPLRRVKLAFDDAPAEDVIRALVAEHLERDYAVGPGVSGVISIDLDAEMSPGDVHDLLNTLASLYGWTIEDRAGLLVVRKLEPASMRSPQTPIMMARAAADTSEVAIRVRRMNHIDAAQLIGGGNNALLSKLLSESAVMATTGRLLVMVDTVAQLNKASALLEAIDVPAFDGVRLETYRLKHKTPQNAAEVLSTLAQGAGLTTAGAANAPLAFVPIIGSDRLAVVARDPSVLGYARTLVEQVDRPDHAEQRFRFLYNIQHADPTSLQNIIAGAFADRIDNAAQTADTDKMRLTWDNAEGRIVINARYDDYAELIETLRHLDRPPQQVLLQNVIAEISLTDDLEFGVEYFLEGFDIEGLGTLEFSANPGSVAGSSGSAFFIGASGLALVQALDAESSANILSQPRLTVTDNAEARFQVGGEVPVEIANQDTDTVTDGDTTIRREIEYRDVGVILSVQPKINDSGDVRLTINLEIRSVGAESALGPTFDTRILETEVVVPHGRTLVLAGFIDDQRNRSSTRTPLLGSIPGVGAAFTSIDNSDLRRELILTITPEVINNPSTVNSTVSGFLAATQRMELILSGKAGELPTGMLREQSLMGERPAVNIVLPERPAGTATPSEAEFIDLPDPSTQGEAAPGTQPQPTREPAPAEADDGDDPLRGLPEDTPEFIKEFLRQGTEPRPKPQAKLPAPTGFARSFVRTTDADAWRWTPPFAIAAAPSFTTIHPFAP